jgi:phenylacetic acid degradation protein paaN
MSHPLFSKHEKLLTEAVHAIRTRGYWSPFPEVPSGKIYGEKANEEGKAAFERRFNQPFDLGQPGVSGEVEEARGGLSAYGLRLGVRYAQSKPDALLAAATAAIPAWRTAGPEAWVGISLEILQRINRRSFEIGYAVMHTTGQAFVMAFQAGGPHAQDRGLEAVAYAWEEMKRVPRTAYWEKPQGKNDPLKMLKTFRIVPRGISLLVGCCTFPTWNGYPGLFASLATGNAVIVKPHPGAILPLALTVEIAREVLREAGFDPNLVTLAVHPAGDDTPQKLALRPEVKLIDFTGSPANGEWLEQHARQAQVYTEKAGVNQVIIDSTADFKGLVRNVSFSLALYSGQMCTAPQNIYVPKDGIDTAEGHLSFDAVAAALGEGLGKLLADPARAVDILGAIQNEGILRRIDESRRLGEIVADSRRIEHPLFPKACIATPLLLKTIASNEAAFMQEVFGPVAFVIATDDTTHSLALAKRAATERGALTLSAYSGHPEILARITDLAAEAGVALSCNLTGGVFVNQSAAFSDYHGTGANPAANASLTDSAFVAGRFWVAQSREHI